MEHIILFEKDSLEVSFNACSVVMTSLPNCCYEGEKKITRDQACPVVCMLIGLRNFLSIISNATEAELEQ